MGKARFADWLDAALWPERDALALWAPAMLGVGVALWFALPWIEERRAALALALVLAASGLLLRGLGRQALCGAGLLVAAGIGVAEVRSAGVAAPRLVFRLPAADVTGTVVRAEIASGGDYARLTLATADGRVRISVPALPAAASPGALVAVPAALGPVGGAAVPGGGDPARRAWFEGVGAGGRAQGPVRVLRPAPAEEGFAAALAGRRARLTAWIAAAVGGEAGGVAAALVTGDQGAVAPGVRDAMRDSGLTHLLSVSGFHIAVVLGGVMWALRRLLGRWGWLARRVSVRALAGVGGGLAATAYTLLAGAEVPAVRACLMAWVVVLAWVLGRDPLSLRLVAAAALVVLLGRPEAVLEPGFQLSFGAVTVLVAVGGSRLGRRLGARGRWWLPTLARRAGLLMLTGVAIELALAPIAAFHFGRQGVWGALANLVGIPFTAIAVMPAVGMILGGRVLGLDRLIDIGAPARWSIDALIALARAVAALPGAVAHVGTPPAVAFVLLLGGGMALATFTTRRRWLGCVPLVAGLGWAMMAPQPLLLVAPRAAHAAVVADDALWMLRRGGGRTLDAWEAAVGARSARRLDALPGARCSAVACAVERGGLRMLLVRSGAPLEPGSLARACAAADVVVADRPLGGCSPRRWLLDRVGMEGRGAVAVRRDGLRSAGPGDHPWMPGAVVGLRKRLLGPDAWDEPMS